MKSAVVVGAGVVGLCTARALSGHGFRVTLCDPDPAGGASNVAAGMLAPVTEVHYGEEALLEWNLKGASGYPAFVRELEAETGLSAGYRPSGTLMVARDADDDALLEDLYRYHAELGLDSERLRPAECRALEPVLGPRVRGGIHVRGDHQVEPRALAAALLAACDRRGVELLPAAVVSVGPGGCRTTGGVELEADHVVIAAGAGSSGIAGLTDLPPIRPVKGQLLNLRGDTPMPDVIVRSPHVYLVPRGDGRVVIGATVEERGFDTTVTAGGVYQLLRDAYEIVPGVVELELVETLAGLRPGTPDNAPVIGESSVSGVVFATGHYRNGVLLAPSTADAVVAGITQGSWPPAFAPSRFVRS